MAKSNIRRAGSKEFKITGAFYMSRIGLSFMMFFVWWLGQDAGRPGGSADCSIAVLAAIGTLAAARRWKNWWIYRLDKTGV